MLDLLLAVMQPPAVTGPAPTVTSVTVASTNSGQCTSGSGTPASSASYTVTTVIADADWTNYQVGLYENGVLVHTFTGTPLTYLKTLAGLTEGGTLSRFAANKTYRADVIRISDSQVVSTKSSAEWTQEYGNCDPGGGV